MISTIWQRMGLWMANPATLEDPAGLGRKCGEAGLGWIAPQVAIGLERPFDDAARRPFDEALKPWLRKFHDGARAAGRQVLTVPWAVNLTRPVDEGALASILFAEYAASAFIFDAEADHKGDETGSDGGPGIAARSDLLVGAWRNARPRAQFGFSSFAAAVPPFVLGDTRDDNRGPMHYRCWLSAGARFLPQAYRNEQGDVSSIGATVAHATRAHWPISYVHPVLGSYPSRYAPTEPDLLEMLADEVADMKGRHILGFSAYIADQTPARILDYLLGQIRPAGTAGAVAWR